MLATDDAQSRPAMAASESASFESDGHHAERKGGCRHTLQPEWQAADTMDTPVSPGVAPMHWHCPGPSSESQAARSDRAESESAASQSESRARHRTLPDFRLAARQASTTESAFMFST